jgi:hypothetical protein
VRVLEIAYIEDRSLTPVQEEWFEQLASIQKIVFRACHFLERLPSTLTRLTTLKALQISLRPVPAGEKFPRTLDELIMDFPAEQESNFKPGGLYWPNISHVPYIRINGRTVQNLSTDAASSSSNHQI